MKMNLLILLAVATQAHQPSNLLPKINSVAPSFTEAAVVNGEFKDVSLSDYRGKWLVFYFYPLDFTFVCPTEIIAFSDRFSEFEEIGTAVVGVSVDSKYTHKAWIDTPRSQGGLGKCNYPLVADLKREISKSYGVLMEEEGHTSRGLFIIDPEQKIRHISVNDPPVGRNVDEVLRLVKAYQFHEKNGEVCPMGWKEGDKTIIDNPTDKLKYFGDVYKDE